MCGAQCRRDQQLDSNNNLADLRVRLHIPVSQLVGYALACSAVGRSIPLPFGHFDAQKRRLTQPLEADYPVVSY